MKTMTFASARVEIEGYHVIGLLARGGMSRVYLARDLQRRRKVAIKVYQIPENRKTEVSEAFLEEARILSRLYHINIVSTYEHGALDDGRLYLVMEYVEGGNLRHRIAQGPDELMAIGTLVELAYILHYVHNHGIIHCDIKPANILFRRDHSLVLTDFGISKHFNDRRCKEKSDTVMVSPDYASPEQIQGLPFDYRTDIYSTGLVFLEMLTGKNLYRGNNLDETLQKHIRMRPPKLNSHLSHYQTLIDGMLANAPENRFQSMQECIECANEIILRLSGENIAPLIPVSDNEETFPAINETTLLRVVGA